MERFPDKDKLDGRENSKEEHKSGESPSHLEDEVECSGGSADNIMNINIRVNNLDGQENTVALDTSHRLLNGSSRTISPTMRQTVDQSYSDGRIVRPYNLSPRRMDMVYILLDIASYHSIPSMGDVLAFDPRGEKPSYQNRSSPLTESFGEERELLPDVDVFIREDEGFSSVPLYCMPKTCRENVEDDDYSSVNDNDMDTDNNWDEDFNMVESSAGHLRVSSGSNPFIANRNQISYIFNPEALGLPPTRHIAGESDDRDIAFEQSEDDHYQSRLRPTPENCFSPSRFSRHISSGEDRSEDTSESECEDDTFVDVENTSESEDDIFVDVENTSESEDDIFVNVENTPEAECEDDLSVDVENTSESECEDEIFVDVVNIPRARLLAPPGSNMLGRRMIRRRMIRRRLIRRRLFQTDDSVDSVEE